MVFLFHYISIQLHCMSTLFESGFAVNGGLDGSGQSPAHLAACGGQAFCLLWLLQTGADANQQVRHLYNLTLFQSEVVT